MSIHKSKLNGAPVTVPAPQGEPRISMIGTKAMLFDAPGEFAMSQQRRIWSLADETAGWPEVEEAVPGVTNLMLVFRTPPRDLAATRAALIEAWTRLPEKAGSGRVIEIPVIYGGELGFDLPAVCAYSGLPPEEVVRIHSNGEYTVCAVGSAPGFGYLHGLDPRIFMPRKTVPSLNMPAGLVTIGGMQTGVAVATGPNGWNSIGATTAQVVMFDARRSPPALLAPGDTVRFRAERIEL